MTAQSHWRAPIWTLLVWLGPVSSLLAAGYAPGPFVDPVPGPFIPPAPLVPGKEYSDHLDKDHLGVVLPEQVIAWDGFGGTRNSFNYTGSRAAFPQVNQPLQVDALAASGDALFHAVQLDTAALAFSVGESGYTGGPADGRVFAEPIAAAGGSGAAFVWATPAIIDSNGVREIDGLELWGSNVADDSLEYSLYGDPFVILGPAGGARKVAVWQYDPAANVSTPHFLTADLAFSMDLQFGGNGSGALFSQLVELMDLDALMVFGSEATFSIAPLRLSQFDPNLPDFDGGEIFEYTAGAATSFLQHGGHPWDTPFDVRGTFGVLSENIDAIEGVAVPEPGTWLLGFVGLTGLAAIGRRMRRR